MSHFYSAFCPLVVDSKNNVAFYQYLFLVIFFCCAGWELGKSWLQGPQGYRDI